MYKIVSQLIVYSGLRDDPVISGLCRTFEAWELGSQNEYEISAGLCRQAAAILDVAAAEGLEGDLWRAYLTHLLVLDENTFTLASERRGAAGGSLDEIAKRDMELLLSLFRFSFRAIERSLGVNCFAVLRDYRAPARAVKTAAGERLAGLCRSLEYAEDAQEVFECLTAFYAAQGAGRFALSDAFRVRADGDGVRFVPVRQTARVTFDDLVGYEEQKRRLAEVMLAFTNGKQANNVLLYGDSGTGKSTCVKAALTEFSGRGLRMIELYKHQFTALTPLISALKGRNYRFVILIDDLSFDEHEVEYKFLKAVIEGGVETRPDNVLICATSNRRHLIRETWKDRSDMEFEGDVHHSDTMEEKLSLSQRFGTLIRFDTPDREQYYKIVDTLAARRGITADADALHAAADAWELRHGGRSGRTARQFIDDLTGRQ